MSHAGNILSKVHKLGIGKYVICRPTATTEWTEMLVVGHIGNQAVELYNPSEAVKGIVMKDLVDEVINWLNIVNVLWETCLAETELFGFAW